MSQGPRFLSLPDPCQHVTRLAVITARLAGEPIPLPCLVCEARQAARELAAARLASPY